MRFSRTKVQSQSSKFLFYVARAGTEFMTSTRAHLLKKRNRQMSLEGARDAVLVNVLTFIS